MAAASPFKEIRAVSRVLLLAVCVGGGAQGYGNEARTDEPDPLMPATRPLLENSPFVPEGFVPPEDRRPPPREEPPPPPEDNPLDRLELRGITVFGEEAYFSFYHPDDQQSFWLGVNETEDGYTLVEYDRMADSVRVLRGETERAITLKESRVQELSRDEQRRQSEQQARTQPGVTTGGRSGEAAAESEDRLRQAAEELRRRRALRSN